MQQKAVAILAVIPLLKLLRSMNHYVLVCWTVLACLSFVRLGYHDGVDCLDPNRKFGSKCLSQGHSVGLPRTKVT